MQNAKCKMQISKFKMTIQNLKFFLRFFTRAYNCNPAAENWKFRTYSINKIAN